MFSNINLISRYDRNIDCNLQIKKAVNLDHFFEQIINEFLKNMQPYIN